MTVSVNNKLVGNGITICSILGSMTSKMYEGPLQNIVYGYGQDLIYPLGMYFLLRDGVMHLGSQSKKLSFMANKYFNAAFVFAGCSTFEIAQGLGIHKGTFDLKDFVAYGIGTGLALTIDSYIQNKENKRNKVSNDQYESPLNII
ncbi:MAG: hypothetical protein PHU51_02645 [Candidatus Nanoarchaeia archaeon]|nr:hypothetical protein [Candidatus Nanoarchaeia archaeon]